MPDSVLITQCLQNDFVKRLDRYEPLPNQLHVGYSEALRLLGEIPEEGPVHRLIEWAYDQPAEKLEILHIRDYHDPQSASQKAHLEQFGYHCLQGTEGADFVFRSRIQDESRHTIFDATGLNDFAETALAHAFTGREDKPLRIGIMGVWTEAKITFLCYDLKTRFSGFRIGVCSALCASSSRSMHFIALDQLQSILGIEVFASTGAFAEFLTGDMPVVRPTPHLRGGNLRIHSELEVGSTDRALLSYLFRDCRSVELKSLDGGFSGNLVLKAAGQDQLGHRQVPVVVKIGPRDAIASERQAFERIQEVLGNAAPGIVDAAEIDERGAIKYRYASMLDSSVETFQDFYQRASIEELLPVLDRVFRNQLGRLYEAASLEKLNLLEYYDFRPAYAEGVRLRVEQLLGRISGKEEILPGLSAASVVPFYQSELPTLQEYVPGQHYVSYVHGDLNGKNILLDAAHNVWLIDFFHTHRGHVLKDLIKLENDILYIFCEINSDQELALACELSRRLYDVVDLAVLPDLTDLRMPPAIEKAAKIVLHLRSYYPDLIFSDRAPYQLHTGALRYAMHTLGFDESSPRQKKWALFSGSLFVDKILAALKASRDLRIDFLADPPVNHVGITLLPGRKDQKRDLSADLACLKDAGITHVINLVMPAELERYGVPHLNDAYSNAGLKVFAYPVADQHAPGPGRLRELYRWIDEAGPDSRVLVHCVGGLGRSGTVVAGWLIHRGYAPDQAIALVREARTARAIETEEQLAFLQKESSAP
ncbi:MAG: isochorismatase family protein [Spirochaetales bacterium]|nr:isochorismatase family protein [Spirochaetales bacterium]